MEKKSDRGKVSWGSFLLILILLVGALWGFNPAITGFSALDPVPEWQGRTFFLLEGLLDEQSVFTLNLRDYVDDATFFVRLDETLDYTLEDDILTIYPSDRDKGMQSVRVFASNGDAQTEVELSVLFYGEFPVLGEEEVILSRPSNPSYPLDMDQTLSLVRVGGTAQLQFDFLVNLHGIEDCVEIGDNRIFLDSEKCPAFDQAARLTFYDPPENAVPLVDGAFCPPDVCSLVVYEEDAVSFNVAHFSEFSVVSAANITVLVDEVTFADESIDIVAQFVNTSGPVRTGSCTFMSSNISVPLEYDVLTESFAASVPLDVGVHSATVTCSGPSLLGPITSTREASILVAERVSSCSSLSSGTYALDQDVSTVIPPCIVISDPDVLFDGNGYTITKSEARTGTAVLIADVRATVQDVNMENFEIGIRVTADDAVIRKNAGTILVRGADNALIAENKIDAVENGIVLQDATSAIVRDNGISGTGIGVFVQGGKDHAIVENLIENGSGSGIVVLGSTLANISSNTITSQASSGVHLYQSSQNVVHGNVIRSSGTGIALEWHTEYTDVSKNVLVGNDIGVSIDLFSNENAIDANTITMSDRAVALDSYAHDNEITDNDLSDNDVSTSLGDYVERNTFIGNMR